MGAETMRLTEENPFDSFVHAPTRAAQSMLLYPLEVGLFDYYPGLGADRQRYDSFQIMYLYSGSMDFDIEGFSGEVPAGSFVLMDCYQPHRYAAVTDSRVLWMHFDGISARYYFDLTASGRGVTFTADEEDRRTILGSMERIYDSFRSGNLVSETLLARELTDMLTICAAQPTAKEPAPKSYDINKVVKYIADHLDEPLTIAQLAAIAGSGERNFIRLFKKAIGYTPHSYITEMRIRTAQILLNNSEYSLQKIGAMCGFSSPSMFSTAFKTRVGISPIEYRKRMR